MDQEERSGTAVTSAASTVSWVVDAPVAASLVFPTIVTTSATSAPIPIPVLDIAGERTVSPTVIASTPDTSQPETAVATVVLAGTTSAPAVTASTSQMDSHHVLRFSDIAFAVRLSRGGQADLVADSLMIGFRNECTRPQIIFAVHAMYALLRDVGSFLCEFVVLARLSTEPAQGVLDDLAGLVDQFMGDNEHHQAV